MRRPGTRRSLARTRAWLAHVKQRRPSQAASVLLITVPEAEFIYERWPRGGLGVPGLPLHVTVLYPFLDRSLIDDEVEHKLRRLAGSHSSFAYSLMSIGRFPGVLYLAPSPADRFADLTRAVHATWPSHPPYGGAYDEIVPHVTLTEGDEPHGLAHTVERSLPIKATARELLLMTPRDDGRWTHRARFPLASHKVSPTGE